MKHKNDFLDQPLHAATLRKRALQGAGIALVLLFVFLLSGEGFDYGFWMFLPMVTVCVAGALGGTYYYFMDHLRHEGSWEKAYANISSILVYILLLWISLIAALNITGHWN